MEVLVSNEVRNLFQGNRNVPSVEAVSLNKSGKWQKTDPEGQLIILFEGKINLSVKLKRERILPVGQLFFLPPGDYCEITALEKCRFTVYKLKGKLRESELLNLNEIYYKRYDFKEDFNPLPIKQEIWDYLQDFLTHIHNGIEKEAYYEIKTRELFFLIDNYYSKKEIAGLFCPLLSRDSSFTSYILANYEDVKTVKEFAETANMSLSTFEKTFRRTFGMPAYKWMKQKKLKRLFYEVTCTSKPLKQIMEECGFSSQSQLNDFCNKNFGIPPGKLRKQSKC